jgi:hypothetical protein
MAYKNILRDPMTRRELVSFRPSKLAADRMIRRRTRRLHVPLVRATRRDASPFLPTPLVPVKRRYGGSGLDGCFPAAAAPY